MVHCGPFGNIAHGTSSVVSQKMGMRMADFVVNETGDEVVAKERPVGCDLGRFSVVASERGGIEKVK